jgi:hypothetical protein
MLKNLDTPVDLGYNPSEVLGVMLDHTTQRSVRED